MPQNVENQTLEQVLESAAKLVCIRGSQLFRILTSKQIGTTKEKLKLKDVSWSTRSVADIKSAARVYIAIPFGESITFGNVKSGYEQRFLGDWLYRLDEIRGGEWSRTIGVVIKVIDAA